MNVREDHKIRILQHTLAAVGSGAAKMNDPKTFISQRLLRQKVAIKWNYSNNTGPNTSLKG